MKTINNYQIQFGFLMPQAASMLIPAATQEEAERLLLEHVNRQFTNTVIIQTTLISSEEVPDDQPDIEPPENTNVFKLFPPSKQGS